MGKPSLGRSGAASNALSCFNKSLIPGRDDGFVLNGEQVGDSSGYSVARAGDVNGDGIADVVIGAYKKLFRWQKLRSLWESRAREQRR